MGLGGRLSNGRGGDRRRGGTVCNAGMCQGLRWRENREADVNCHRGAFCWNGMESFLISLLSTDIWRNPIIDCLLSFSYATCNFPWECSDATN